MIVRQAGLTSIAAGASVAAGLLLDLCIAAKFGAGHASDAFFVAVRIPLALGVVAMIVANQAMLPTFALQDTRVDLIRQFLDTGTRLVKELELPLDTGWQ